MMPDYLRRDLEAAGLLDEPYQWTAEGEEMLEKIRRTLMLQLQTACGCGRQEILKARRALS